ncbi:DUF4179 domain-containing protein [Cohnella candidum]|uniref:DUF4179 domain-containing protein n=1 Tax=Cohnella candidum TaxID=2674991 RepID=A0A3G3JT54_9BACL|nr:DUF4179 domain-containing protein [Cohnella candidum]AYQ71405.1 DUF4179 domain-containing protein [Cohnella candidum]
MPNETVHESDLTEKIEAAIAEGLRRGQSEKSRRRTAVKRRAGGAAAACLLLVACLFTIRVSPVFAAFVREIPGFEKFVDLIASSQDKGIQLAVDNDFLQPLGVSDEHDGMKLTVQGIIADESRMVVFYEVAVPAKHETVRVDTINVSDVGGTPLPAGIGYSYPQEQEQDVRESGVYRGTFDVALADGQRLPDKVIIGMKLQRVKLSDGIDGAPKSSVAGSEGVPVKHPPKTGITEFKMTIPIDTAKSAGLRKEIPIGQTIRAEGQAVTFTKAVLSPLRVTLYLEFDSNNTKQIFGPGDIRLVDDKGTVWKNISGSAGTDKDRLVVHFESPYFNQPKSLTVEGSWFRALDKDEMMIQIDTERRRLLTAPDKKLTLHMIGDTDQYVRLDFELNGVNPDDNMLYTLLEGEFTDGKGITHRMADLKEVVSGSKEGDGPQHVYYYLDKVKYPQPLTFRIYNYPDYVRQAYRIEIHP